MFIFCTYCSAEKRLDEGEMAAILRYKSSRIERVYRAAGLLGLKFYILSGEYGLLTPDESIPWYDHLLMPEEVNQLAGRVSEQIARNQITGIVYFTNSVDVEPAIAPYRETIITACSRAGCRYTLIEATTQSFND